MPARCRRAGIGSLLVQVKRDRRSAVVLAVDAGVTIDDEALDQGIVLGDDVGGDRIGILLFHLADFEPRIAAPVEPAFHAALHVVGGEIELLVGTLVGVLIALDGAAGAVAGTVSLHHAGAVAVTPHHAGAVSAAPTAHVTVTGAFALPAGGAGSRLVVLPEGGAIPRSRSRAAARAAHVTGAVAATHHPAGAALCGGGEAISPHPGRKCGRNAEGDQNISRFHWIAPICLQRLSPSLEAIRSAACHSSLSPGSDFVTKCVRLAIRQISLQIFCPNRPAPN